jgi:hypothetical protein
MSKRKRNRRPGGHPANIAKRPARDEARRSRIGIGTEELARRLVRHAPRLRSALEAEVWASSLLGAIWSRRNEVLLTKDSPDYHFVFGRPLIEAIARAGGVGARIALLALAAVDDSELGTEARDLAGALADGADALPPWVGELGRAEITGAAVMHDDVFDDACTVWLEARHRGGEVHAIGVTIDNNLGAMATDVVLADSLDQVEEVMRDHASDIEELTLDRIDPGIAAGRIHAAIELTDMTWDPPLSDDYPDRRALALRRVDEAPGYVVPDERPDLSLAERDQLRDEFLSSPEGAGFPSDSEEAYAVSLAIDFCADYVDGRPLRWSPEVVEFFMADWIPRKVLGDAALFDCLPTALDAWVRFAGRKSNLPEWAITATREQISRCRETMVRRSEDPAVAGPAKEFMVAAQDAGVDLEDRDALNTFIAGWNARGTLA